MVQKINILNRNKIAAMGLCLALFPLSVFSDWLITPRISVLGTYSDNIELAGDDEESDFVTEVNPNISIVRNSSRLNLAFDYLMQNTFYADDSDRNETFHQLDFVSNADIIRDFFSLAIDARAEQVLESQREGVTIRNINANASGNDTDVYTAGIAPQIMWDFGGYATANARFRYSVQDYSEDSSVIDGDGDFDDNKRAETTVSFGNLERDRLIGAQVQFVREKINFDDRSTIVFERTQGDLAYNLTPRIALVGTYGYEDNDFIVDPTEGNVDGTYWDAGIRYEITPRNLIEVRRGDRFFGNTWNGLWEFRGRRLDANVRYTESITSDALNDDIRDFGESPGFANNDINTDAPSDRTSVFETKRLDISATLNLAKSSYTLGAFRDDRKFLDTQLEEESYGVNFDWQWQFAPRTRLGFDIFWQREDFDDPADPGDEDTQDTFDLALELVRALAPRTEGSLGYTYTHGDSETFDEDYTANTVSVGLTHEF